ncbi:MAG: TAT-variant-translocated molybdopterin oxidoreductase [Bacteroidia bacterium]
MNKPKYWRGLEELEQTPEFLAEAKKEFSTDVPMDQAIEDAGNGGLEFNANRRDFLKVLGFGVTAATLAACVETPVKKAIPYVEKPEDVIPGVPNWYASTTNQGIPVLVKAREGRPIKLEGNPDSPLTRGGLDAVSHATLLEVYDLDRLRNPLKGAEPVEWDAMDKDIKAKLADIKARGGKVRVVSGSVLSPSTRQIIADFVGQFENGKHVAYDAVSYDAINRAHENLFGKRGIPSVMLDRADVILGINCDFLGTWLDPTTMNAQYAENRQPEKGKMSRHFQLESLLTMTGSNADLRFPINPSDEGRALVALYNKVARRVGQPQSGSSDFNVAGNNLDNIAEELVNARGRAVVLCGSNDLASQEAVAGINNMLGAYGKTLDLGNPYMLKQGNDADMAALASELNTVDALFFYDANPVYNSPYADAFKAALGGNKLTVTLTVKEDETSELSTYTAATSHYLESWGDAQQTASHSSVIQPAINPIFSTRQAQDSFLIWSDSQQTYYDYLKAYWRANMYPGGMGSFQRFWDETLRKGVVVSVAAQAEPITMTGNVGNALSNLSRRTPVAEGAFELAIYEKVSMRDGSHANNPWLQELPDPITRTTWDNYLTVPAVYAKANDLDQNDVVSVTVGDQSFDAAVMIQPGQAMQTLGLALGYNRPKAGRVASQVKGSVDAYPLVKADASGNRNYNAGTASISKTGRTYDLACTQTGSTLFDPGQGPMFGTTFDRTHHIISEETFEEYKKNPGGVNEDRRELRNHLVTLWESHYEDREANRYIKWAMAIDLNKCTGCGACVISCHAENNVPVVGKQEVLNRRDMHWMRIDRYFSGDPENPDVVFQPMLCQHCDNAPCETVCPVLATIHSHEGLNQMAYNRCVGTRYCANNCPYKVRRFNWFNYYNGDQFADVNPAQNELGRLVLNPDVTVRFRGVMEKCSFCVQRLQDGKLRAKIDGNSSLVKPKDGDIKTACQQSCPTGAIVFGDLNDPESAVSKLYKNNSRAYHALEEVKVLPSVAYLSKIRNRTEEEQLKRVPEAEEVRFEQQMEWLDVKPQVG